ncbi:hypothetical protein C0995_006420 [Termitomyces sp. Mi166|nr:hypothetical protein C0995_006420 [Termitomyces sp. Mi166\
MNTHNKPTAQPNQPAMGPKPPGPIIVKPPQLLPHCQIPSVSECHKGVLRHAGYLKEHCEQLKQQYEMEKGFHEALSIESQKYRRLCKEEEKENLDLLEKLRLMGLKEIEYKHMEVTLGKTIKDNMQLQGLLAPTVEEEHKHLEKALAEAMEENGHLKELLKSAAEVFMKVA